MDTENLKIAVESLVIPENYDDEELREEQLRLVAYIKNLIDNYEDLTTQDPIGVESH